MFPWTDGKYRTLPSELEDLRMKTDKPSFWLSCPLLHLHPVEWCVQANHFTIASRTISTLGFLNVYTYGVSPLATRPKSYSDPPRWRCLSWTTLSETTKCRCLSLPALFLIFGLKGIGRERNIQATSHRKLWVLDFVPWLLVTSWGRNVKEGWWQFWGSEPAIKYQLL